MLATATPPKTLPEWVKLSPEIAIAATPDCVWVCHPDSVSNEDSTPLPVEHWQQVAITQKLLDTSIVLAKRAVSSPPKIPVLTPVHWVWQLADQYHTSHPVPGLMQEAAERFAVAGRKSLAEWATHKAVEEEGHDRLALLDIQALGYEAKAVVETLVPPSATALVDYFTRSIQTPDPIGCVGYTYTLERLATAISAKHVQAVEAQLPPDVRATRFLRVHSSIGSDAEHVDENIELVATLTPEERNQVAIACYETALLYLRPSQPPSDEELCQLLSST